MKIIWVRGMQASGKSTWTEEFITKNQNYKRVNRDLIRQMLSNYTYNDVNEKLVTIIENQTIDNLIEQEYNIVIDRMNLNMKQLHSEINKLKQKIENKGLSFEYEIKEFPISLSEAILRDSKRSKVLGKNVLKNTWNKYELELKEMINKHKPKLIQNENLEKCILVDVDGTLSNSMRRRIFESSEEEILKDEVIEQVKLVVSSLFYEKANNKKLKVFIFSGREEIFKNITTEWLHINNIPFDDIYMRKEKDYRPDTIVKREMFNEYIRDKYNCLFVIDDRPRVVQEWTELGLFVFNVNQDPYAKNDF